MVANATIAAAAEAGAAAQAAGAGKASTGGSGGATAEEIWNYVLSNGLTAGDTLAQALAEAETCCGGH